MTNRQDDFEYRLFEAAKTRHQLAIAEFATDDDLIEQRFANVKIEVQDRDIALTKPPTASDAIQNASDHILTNPKITVPVRPVESGREAAEKVAEEQQQFYQMWWHNAFTYCGDPLGRGKTQLIKGKLALKKTLRWDLLPVLPARPTRRDRDRYRAELGRAARSSFMWKLEVVPKESVYEDVARPWDPDYVFEAYSINARDAIKQFPNMMPGLASRDPLAEVEYVEYWERPYGDSKGKFIQWVDGERVHTGPNPYCWDADYEVDGRSAYQGYVPYAIGDPGWGDESAKAAPEKRYVSIIHRARSILEAECRMLTMVDEYQKFYTFKPLRTLNVPAVKPLDNVPGAVWDLQEGQEADFVQPGDMPAGIFAAMSRVNAYADQTSKFGALGGLPQRGVDTATEADQNIRNAATKLSGPIRTLRRMIMQINMQVAQDIEKVLEAPMTLYGATGSGPSEATLMPSEINGFYMTYVELETSDEAALNLRNANLWANLAERIRISPQTVLRMIGVQNPSQEEERWLEAQLESAPQFVNALVMLAMQNVPALAPLAAQAGAAEGGGEQSKAQPPPPGDAVAALRVQAQRDAVAAMPDRTMM